MSGWIKLQRDIMDHWIAQDAEYLLVWVRMLSEANYETQTKMFNGQVITVGRGQLIFGLDSYAAKTKVSVMRLRRLLDTMEKHQMINRVKNAKYSLISIVNYDKYQADNRQTTAIEQAQNSQTTVKQQADNNTKRNKELEEGKQLSLDDSGESTKEAFLNGLFEKFWKNYTCEKTAKVKKQDAKKAFLRLMRGKSDKKAEMLTYAMLVHYQDNLVGVVFGADRMHPTTYINKRQWEDNPEFLEDFEKQWELENAQ
jgi:hypothetical protein